MGSNPTLSAKRFGVVPGLVAALCACAVLFVAFPTHAACEPTYVVKRGDSWWSIARSSNVSLKALLKLNGARTSTVIQPKDQVCVPQVTQTPTTQYTQEEVTQIIRDVWPDDLEDRAIAIARRESNLRPGVIGVPNNCCYGLFQIYYKWHKTWLPNVGVTHPRQLLDPKLNAIAAFRMYQRNNGWAPWE